VRGVRSDLRIALGGQSLIVRGDNGTGKSSVVRGLQWALRDEAAPTGSAATGEEPFRAHVLEAPTAPRTSIDFVDRTSLVVATDGVTGESLREGLDETLTVLRLNLPAALRRTFATTNPIENMNGSLRRIARNVKRWKDEAMMLAPVGN
jgi:hypothetical protein